MYLAYVVDVNELFVLDSNDEILEDGSERLEKIAKELSLDHDCLGFEQAAIIISRDISHTLTFTEVERVFQDNAAASKTIAEKLKLHNVEVSEPVLVTEPDWDKYGVCHNYE